MTWSILAHASAIGLCIFVSTARTDAEPSIGGVTDAACPTGSITVPAGASIEAAVERAGEGATFCLKRGVHRLQVVRPMRNQRFYGEEGTILNGSRVLTAFVREDRYWVAIDVQTPPQRDGRCATEFPACNVRTGVYVDDRALVPAQSKAELDTGCFYLDASNGRIYLVDDPAGHIVEATVDLVAFESFASGVSISNLIIEKYASLSQRGAVQARHGDAWTIENCEVRLNTGGGIGIGNGARVRSSNIHHNGQIGIAGVGKNVVIENNRIWANNTRGYDFKWEAGGVKLALSERVEFRANSVYDNVGPGIWCDISCRDVVYDGNHVERNHDAGIFFEISYQAVIRNNVIENNGISSRKWFWGADILIAASQSVVVEQNQLTVGPDGCGIVLVDQSRRIRGGGKYKTRDDVVRDNVIAFQGSACAGGVSDAPDDDENFSIITNGNNHFDHNTYIVPRQSTAARFVWGHSVFGWDEFRRQGQEANGALVLQ